MKRCVILLALILAALARPSIAQEYPKPTSAGEEALEELGRRCINSGG